MMQKQRAGFWIFTPAIVTSIGLSILFYHVQDSLFPQVYFIPMMPIIPLSLVAGGCVRSVIPSWRNRHSDVMFIAGFCFAIVLFTVLFILSGEGLDVGNLEDPSLPAALFCAFAASALFGVGSFDKLENWRKKDGE